jgi:Zn-dependent M28 family amino/carboxypeptidase
MIKAKRFAIAILVGLLVTSTFYAQDKEPVTEDMIKADVNAVPCKNADRLEAVKRLFAQAGASDADMTVQKLDSVKNLVVTKKGKTDETVIVSAHYDKVDEGCGAIDNWTGIVIIENLYRTMRKFNTNKTYLFVAFDKEEKGLLGSAAMAKAIPKEQRVNYCSNVNLDSFGFNYPHVLDNASSAKMTATAKSLADELKMPFSHSSITDADADSSSFNSHDIPAITFDGLDGDWQKYLHSSNDVLKNIKIGSVYIGYQYLLRYLIKIDGSECGVFRKGK